MVHFEHPRPNDLLSIRASRCRKEKVTPWDAGAVQPPLRDVLSSGQLLLPSSGRAFVPGCGKVTFDVVPGPVRA